MPALAWSPDVPGPALKQHLSTRLPFLCCCSFHLGALPLPFSAGQALWPGCYFGHRWCLPTVVIVQSLSCVQLFATPWTAACQASLSFTSSRNLLRHMSIVLVMPSNLCCRLLLPSIFHSISVFSNESALCIRWSKYYSVDPDVCCVVWLPSRTGNVGVGI